MNTILAHAEFLPHIHTNHGTNYLAVAIIAGLAFAVLAGYYHANRKANRQNKLARSRIVPR